MSLIINFPGLASGVPVLQLPPTAYWIKNHWGNPAVQEPPGLWRAMPETKQKAINMTGLATLFISGSVSPTLQNLLWLKRHYGQDRRVFLIDLRQETHLYINGLPVSIFDRRDQINWGKSPNDIQEQEQAWKERILPNKKITLNHMGMPVDGFKVPETSFTLAIKSVHLEKTAASMANLQYHRIEVPDYHPPSPAHVDAFLGILKNLPEHYWLHFHCAGGKGRTTTFLAMTDIIHNHKDVSLNDIVKRQAFSAGIDLMDDSVESLKNQPWKQEYKTARKEFIQLFYRYAAEAYPQKTFTTWLAGHQKGAYFNLLQTSAYYQS